MHRDRTRLTESASVGIQAGAGEFIAPWCVRRLEKFDARHYRDALSRGEQPQPYDVLIAAGNIVMNGGADLMWERLITKNPSTSSTGALTQAFSSDNLTLQVGASTASTGSRTLAALVSTDKYAIASSVFTHTSGTSTAARTLTVTGAFTSSEANFAWNEWGVKNSTITGSSAGRLLNRKVESLGTKTSAGVWTLTLNLTLS